MRQAQARHCAHISDALTGTQRVISGAVAAELGRHVAAAGFRWGGGSSDWLTIALLWRSGREIIGKIEGMMVIPYPMGFFSSRDRSAVELGLGFFGLQIHATLGPLT